MSSGIGFVLMTALLCAASGLLLWQRAQNVRGRAMTDRFVERRVAPVQGVSQAADAARAVQRPRVNAPSSMPSQSAPQSVRDHLKNYRERVLYAFANLMSRAGVTNPRMLLSITGGIVATGALALGARTHWFVGAGFIGAGLACLYVILRWRAKKRYRRITRQLPVFLDGIVRLIIIGNSVPASFQAALTTTEAPLRECLDRVSRMLRSGVEIDVALRNVAVGYRVRELELVGSVLRVSVRYGGRSDVMLDRMAALMRDLEQAERELVALTTETRLSSWVLGLLPVVVGAFVIISNPAYFGAMWLDPLGQRLVIVAVCLQLLGVFLLYSLARLKD